MVDNVSIDDTVGTVVDALYDLIERTRGARLMAKTEEMLRRATASRR